MSNYLRPRINGASIFFTVALADRQSDLLMREFTRLRDAVQQTRNERPFHIGAWVVLPDHLHTVWTLPPDDTNYSVRWRLIKSRFSRGLPKGRLRASHNARQERGIWQRRYWEHHIRNQRDYDAHIQYCHNNPVKHGYVNTPTDWLHSSLTP